MNKIVFTKVCVDDIQYLKRCNKVQLLSKLKEILNFLKNNNPPYKTYKAEKFPQKSQFQGCWSMRLSDKDRVLFKYENGEITVLRAHGHYDD